MYKRLLVGYDGSKCADSALRRAVVLAKEGDAQLTMLWMCEPLPRYYVDTEEFEVKSEVLEDFYKTLCEEATSLAAGHRVSITCERGWGDPAEGVVRFADKGRCDLIVVGHSNHSELWGRVLGDTADRIADNAHCSVLIVKDHESGQ